MITQARAVHWRLSFKMVGGAECASALFVYTMSHVPRRVVHPVYLQRWQPCAKFLMDFFTCICFYSENRRLRARNEECKAEPACMPTPRSWLKHNFGHIYRGMSESLLVELISHEAFLCLEHFVLFLCALC